MQNCILTDYQPFNLPELKLTASVAIGYLIRPEPDKGSVLIPDFWIENTVSDIKNGTDKYFEKAMELIDKE